MSNISLPQQQPSPASFFDEMIQMEKELPLEMQEFLYKKVKKMRALTLAKQFDAKNYDFQLDEKSFDDLLQQIANEK
jgi:Lhr-like helicase